MYPNVNYVFENCKIKRVIRSKIVGICINFTWIKVDNITSYLEYFETDFEVSTPACFCEFPEIVTTWIIFYLTFYHAYDNKQFMHNLMNVLFN